MDTIAKFLYGDEWTEYSMATQMSRLHQYCHIALTLNTAQGVIESSVKSNDGKAIINSYANMDNRKQHKADYLVALNYYNNDDLETYLDYFNTALSRVVQHIKARHIIPTTNSVIKMLNEIGMDVVRASTPLSIGDKIETKNRRDFNVVLAQLVDESLTPEEFLDECSDIKIGRAFTL